MIVSIFEFTGADLVRISESVQIYFAASISRWKMKRKILHGEKWLRTSALLEQQREQLMNVCECGLMKLAK